MPEETRSRDDAYRDPYFLDDLVAFLREGGREKYDDTQKSVLLTAYRENVYFVHGLDNHDSYSAPMRAFNNLYKSPEDRLAFLLTVKPAISASHVRDAMETWSSAGVILRDGDIVFASHGDYGTSKDQRNGLSKRNVDLCAIRAVCSRSEGRYSEFVVKNPTPAGLYLRILEDEGVLLVDTRDGTYHQYRCLSDEWNLPLYALHHGELFTFTQLEDGTVQLGNKLTRREVLERNIALPTERCEQEQERVLTDPSFVIGDMQDYGLYFSREKGRRVFLDLFEVENIDALDHDHERLWVEREISRKYRPYESLETFQGLIDDSIFTEMPFGFVEIEVGRARFGFYRTFNSPDQVLGVLEDVFEQYDGISSYLSEHEDGLRSLSVQGVYDLYGNGDPRRYIVTPYSFKKDYDEPYMGAFFYGFADEAKKAGRIDLSERAEALAQIFLPKGEITSLLDKRLATNGGFRTYLDEVRMSA